MIKHIVRIVLASLALSVSVIAQDVNVAFYSDFEPISYSKSRETDHPDFNEALGYEPALLRAIEQIPGSDLAFNFHGIKKWDGLWYIPAERSDIDLATGGMTIEERRTRNANGERIVAFTHPTVRFHQSLLVLAEDAPQIRTHQDLTCADTVGAVRGTTGEYRFLAQAGLIDDLAQGRLKKGVSVILPERKTLTSDGKLSIYDARLKERLRLHPERGDCSLPTVRYFVAEDSMVPALKARHISAVARGYIGNSFVADRSDGELVVTAIYSLETDHEYENGHSNPEQAGMTVSVQDDELRAKLNAYIDYLTDGGKIGYSQWKANPKIFSERAAHYSA